MAAEPPAAIVTLFREAAEELTEQNARGFLDRFDRTISGYAQLKGDVEGLLIRGPLVSTLEFVSDEGNDQRRELQIDWLWRLEGGAPHRAIVKCRVERQGRAWKITRFEPVGLFSGR